MLWSRLRGAVSFLQVSHLKEQTDEMGADGSLWERLWPSERHGSSPFGWELRVGEPLLWGRHRLWTKVYFTAHPSSLASFLTTRVFSWQYCPLCGPVLTASIQTTNSITHLVPPPLTHPCPFWKRFHQLDNFNFSSSFRNPVMAPKAEGGILSLPLVHSNLCTFPGGIYCHALSLLVDLIVHIKLGAFWLKNKLYYYWGMKESAQWVQRTSEILSYQRDHIGEWQSTHMSQCFPILP